MSALRLDRDGKSADDAPTFTTGVFGMPSIEINRSHRLGKQKARSAADRLVSELAKEFEVDYAWQGDHLHFERPGVSGVIEVSAGAIHIRVDLSLFLFAFKSKIESEIYRYLEQHFA